MGEKPIASSPGSVLRSERLDLVPLTHAVVEAALADRARLEVLLAAEVAPDWPDMNMLEVLSAEAEALRNDPGRALWRRVLLTRSPRRVIGSAGFSGLPDAQGRVEIGYGIAQAYQGRGYATEAVRALLRWAATQPGVRACTAACLADNLASSRVLEKVGMQRLFQVGDVIYWERPA